MFHFFYSIIRFKLTLLIKKINILIKVIMIQQTTIIKKMIKKTSKLKKI